LRPGIALTVKKQIATPKKQEARLEKDDGKAEVKAPVTVSVKLPD
jgi:hypothetical protein